MEPVIGTAPNHISPHRSYAKLWDMVRSTDEWVSMPDSAVGGRDARIKAATLRESARSMSMLVSVVVEDGRIFVRRKEEMVVTVGSTPRSPRGVALQPAVAINETEEAKSLTSSSLTAARPIRALARLREEINTLLCDLYALADEEEWASLNLGGDRSYWPTYQGEVIVRALELCRGYRIDWSMDGCLMYLRLVRRPDVTNNEKIVKSTTKRQCRDGPALIRNLPAAGFV